MLKMGLAIMADLIFLDSKYLHLRRQTPQSILQPASVGTSSYFSRYFIQHQSVLHPVFSIRIDVQAFTGTAPKEINQDN